MDISPKPGPLRTTDERRLAPQPPAGGARRPSRCDAPASTGSFTASCADQAVVHGGSSGLTPPKNQRSRQQGAPLGAPESPSSKHLPNVPVELLLHVASFTTLAGHREARLTCRSLRAPFADPRCWRGVIRVSLDAFASTHGTTTRHTMMMEAGLLEAIRPFVQQAPDAILPEMEDKIRVAWENAIQSRSRNGQFRPAFASLTSYLRPHQVDAQFAKACNALLRRPTESVAELAHVAAFKAHMSDDELDTFVSEREAILRSCALDALSHLGPRLSDAQAVLALRIWMSAPEANRFALESPEIMALPRCLARAEGREAFREEVCDRITALVDEANRYTVLPNDTLIKLVCRRKLLALLQTLPTWFGAVAPHDVHACLPIQELIDLAAQAGDEHALILLSSIAPLLENAGEVLDALNALAEASDSFSDDENDEQIDSSRIRLRIAITREVDVKRLVQILTSLWSKAEGQGRALAEALAGRALSDTIGMLAKPEQRPRDIPHHEALPAVLAGLRALSTILGVETVKGGLSASTKRAPRSIYHRVQMSWFAAHLDREVGDTTAPAFDRKRVDALLARLFAGDRPTQWPDSWSSRPRHTWQGFARLAPVLTQEQAAQALRNFDAAWAKLDWFAYVPALMALVPRLDAEGFRTRYAAARLDHRIVMFAHAPACLSHDAFNAAQLAEIDAWLTHASPEAHAQAADTGHDGAAPDLRYRRRNSVSDNSSDFESVGDFDDFLFESVWDFDSDHEVGDAADGSEAGTFTEPEILSPDLQALYDALTPREATRKAAVWGALAQRVMLRRAQMLSPAELEHFREPSDNV